MLEAGKSYALVSSSDLLKQHILEYLRVINEEAGINKVASIFGKQLIVSDTATPTPRSIVISLSERNQEGIENINLDEKITEFLFTINGIDIKDKKNIFNYIRNKNKKLSSEIAYFNTLICINYIDNLTLERIDKIYSYKHISNHTATEYYQVLIDFINNPTEVNLHYMLNVFDEDSYQKLINCMGVLTNETPEWLVRKMGDYLNDAEFVKRLLKLSLVILKSNNRESFVLFCLKDLIL